MKSPIIRTLACLLAVFTLTLCFAACGGGSNAGLSFKTKNNVEIVIGADADDTISKLGNWSAQNSPAAASRARTTSTPTAVTVYPPLPPRMDRSFARSS